ncbi:class I SAM-dependent methyltransferase [Heyndrickxia sporothermodurans]|uniref:Class I SAM-dependent methyltransferase n=2 Tax=Heyndrickxia sporothermodurans TaxID=46224 RepID=A0AB37HN29_9BACI|nr:class I SAM-dependent methyltransferase [Heyndrickxia sporothermodurans]MBL5768460.1 class I SAM-dependent methyltransferase [Heyndrickxia sporothermodurans]MBL5772114.1 class I SAM-dependent methyltransferase [Heyndrickxia sporothermodurans]MBL5779069.1 class I SAM-dependent methyltransferase [Heyndrickxia sporothermodurans]MBL5782697.1 class I SAM-dependent methyltransferase [Heyndrickxia sporothermodurans]MBL5786350.1 class I SAM-dependent methyltransferase [Heyndrickxia sporothermoduran
MENFEEYDDPILYDKENDPYTADIPFLLKWAAKTEGTIIDVACGTGRATIPLAKNGHKLIGVDVHNGMLAEAKRKTDKLNLPIEWIEQDCAELNLNVVNVNPKVDHVAHVKVDHPFVTSNMFL